MPMERWFTIASFVYFIVFASSRIVRESCCSFTESIAFALNAFIIVTHLFIAHAVKKNLPSDYKILDMVILKALRVFAVSMGILLWPMVSENKDLWHTVLLRGGVMINFAYGLGLPLMFKENILLQFLLTFGSSFVRISSTCDVLFNHFETRDHFFRVWNSTNRWFMTIAGLLEPSKKIEDQPFDKQYHLCSHWLFVLYFVISFAFPMLIQRSMELASRRKFIEEQSRQREWQSLILASPSVPNTSISLGKHLTRCSFKTVVSVVGLMVLCIYWVLFVGL